MTQPQRPWYVYILQCSDGKFYAGITTDIDERLKTHQEGRGSYFTRCRLPVKLVYSEPHDSQSSARKREMQIKKWGKKNKQTLVDNQYMKKKLALALKAAEEGRVVSHEEVKKRLLS